jgi:hypothetical protein
MFDFDAIAAVVDALYPPQAATPNTDMAATNTKAQRLPGFRSASLGDPIGYA